MDIASLSRSVPDVVCSSASETGTFDDVEMCEQRRSRSDAEGDTKASLETRADGGEERKAPSDDPSAAASRRDVRFARGDATSYAATATAMGMSEEAFRENTALKADAADEKQPSLKAPSPLDAYVFAKQLGVGLTGSVYKAWRASPRVPRSHSSVGPGERSATERWVPVAVKVMDKVKILDINETAHVVQESKIMRSVSRHPFIVSMIESFQTTSAMFIAMEYAAAKDLFHMIHEHGALRLSQCRAFVVQTVLALDHVHAKGFVYRDLKPENLLVREDGYLRLTDFGFAKALRPGERAYTVCGTPDYLAPETLRQQGCTRAADFWAVGVLLFEMLTGYPPFHGQTHSELYRRITSGRVRAHSRAASGRKAPPTS